MVRRLTVSLLSLLALAGLYVNILLHTHLQIIVSGVLGLLQARGNGVFWLTIVSIGFFSALPVTWWCFRLWARYSSHNFTVSKWTKRLLWFTVPITPIGFIPIFVAEGALINPFFPFFAVGFSFSVSFLFAHLILKLLVFRTGYWASVLALLALTILTALGLLAYHALYDDCPSLDGYCLYDRAFTEDDIELCDRLDSGDAGGYVSREICRADYYTRQGNCAAILDDNYIQSVCWFKTAHTLDEPERCEFTERRRDCYISFAEKYQDGKYCAFLRPEPEERTGEECSETSTSGKRSCCSASAYSVGNANKLTDSQLITCGIPPSCRPF